ncbi:hypothetical protein LTR85_009950 [Meristemomyces frigidus]|nr:hypothetical protein LTR85_009950 [Meristemomyces frigidus]
MLSNTLFTIGALALGTANALLSNVTIFTPPANYTIPRTLYARTVLLNQDCETSDVLLATWENYLPNNDSNPYFPIYQSLDLGATWSERSRVYDQANGWGLRYQPFLYELPEAIGNFSAGTILLAGNSIPNDLSETQIDLYASTDKGYTWTFVSHIAHGGEALPDNGLTPVWEPFLMMYEDQLVAYYSDQRDPLHGQKLVHQTSTNLLNWTAPVDDVAYSNYTFRPGMTTVSELPLGNWIMTYEFYGAPEAAFAVYYRISNSPLTFNNSVGRPIIATDGTVPVSSPYNVWTPIGGSLGTIAVSCGTLSEVFLNHNLGAPGAWTKVPTPEGVSYTRSLRVLPDESEILITGGGILSGTNNSVTTSSIDITPAGPKLASCNSGGTYGKRMML